MTLSNPQGATVVVVDDQNSVRMVLKRAMEKQGYQVISLASARACLEYCANHHPDAILLDTMMPETDGFTCCQLLQQQLGDRCPPILMVTALDDRASVDRAFEVGATDYITKPIHWPVLYNRVAKVIVAYRTSQSLHHEILRSQKLAQDLVIANADLEQKVSDRTKELQESLKFESLLKRIADRVRETLNEAYILETVVWELVQGLNLDSASVGFLNPKRDTYTVRYECTPAAPSFEGQTISASDYPNGWHCFEDGDSKDRLWSHPLRGQVSALFCPLQDEDGQLLGMLNLMRPPAVAFSEPEKRLAQQVANQCAIATRQARLYEAAQHKITELQRLNQLKDDFLSTISHELRTPLSSMRMALQLLKHAPCQQKQKQYQLLLETECEREIRLVEDLLMMQDLTAHAEISTSETIELNQYMEQLVVSKEDTASSRDISLVLKGSAHPCWVRADAIYLKRALVELLDNACKHTVAGGQIVAQIVEPTAKQEGVTVSIRNTGSIPQSELNHLFETFHRVQQADRWKTSGIGLGLALVKQVIERLGGSISVSNAENWVQFDLCLPISQNHRSSLKASQIPLAPPKAQVALQC